jgi:hypothetical protein
MERESITKMILDRSGSPGTKSSRRKLVQNV